MKHLTFLFCFILFFANSFAQKKSNPNIIFILADDMGFSDMSWQDSRIQTPNLDKIKSEGMYLNRHYCQPQCSPTRVAFLTGNYPYRYGLHEHIVLSDSYTGIPGETVTIAEQMQKAGYETAIIGKWHVGGRLQSYLPHHQGFDHSLVCINGAISYWNYTHAGHSDLLRNGEKVYAPTLENSEASGNQYSTYMFADEAVKIIKKQDDKKPLFMYLAFNAPHHPLQAPKELIEKYPIETIEDYWSAPDAEKRRKAKTRQLYMAMVDAMDQAIGKVLKALEDKDILDNTLVVFCSDNGGIIEADNRPLRSIKGDSFEGGIRTSCVAQWPGMIKPGSQSDELVHVSDWYATFSEITETKPEQELDGTSALNILKGGKGNRDHIAIISEQRHALICADFALVGNSQNYLRSLNNELQSFQLYDLREDVSQSAPAYDMEETKYAMQQALMSYFPKVNRGYFNWDIKYAKYRTDEANSDHSYDYVINDLPELDVNTQRGKTTVLISPVNKQLEYKLQGSNEGQKWKTIKHFIPKVTAEDYTLEILGKNTSYKNYRVSTGLHYQLPIYDSFTETEGYKTGKIESQKIKGTDLMKLETSISGFLPVVSTSSPDNVSILKDGLTSKSQTQNKGALQIQNSNKISNAFFTRYFQEPFNTGKVYLSMLVHFEAIESESKGEINLLVQNGWGGTTEKQVSLKIQNDGIYCSIADTHKGNPPTKYVGNYNIKTIQLLFEIELGVTGQDQLDVYVNPQDGINNAHHFGGEFTFDRLQFAVTGRAGGKLTVDELRVGRYLEDVIDDVF